MSSATNLNDIFLRVKINIAIAMLQVGREFYTLYPICKQRRPISDCAPHLHKTLFPITIQTCKNSAEGSVAPAEG